MRGEYKVGRGEKANTALNLIQKRKLALTFRKIIQLNKGGSMRRLAAPRTQINHSGRAGRAGERKGEAETARRREGKVGGRARDRGREWEGGRIQKHTEIKRKAGMEGQREAEKGRETDREKQQQGRRAGGIERHNDRGRGGERQEERATKIQRWRDRKREEERRKIQRGGQGSHGKRGKEKTRGKERGRKADTKRKREEGRGEEEGKRQRHTQTETKQTRGKVGGKQRDREKGRWREV